jgi:hypothetical protein
LLVQSLWTAGILNLMKCPGTHSGKRNLRWHRFHGNVVSLQFNYAALP